jgi:DNA-binding transcriptional ArsR family regulator
VIRSRDAVASRTRRRPSARPIGPPEGRRHTPIAAPVLTYNQMVVAELTEAEIDRVFHALADATRRDLLRRAADGTLSVSRLADGYDMSFAAVQKHVAVLGRAGLVTKARHGREQLVRTDPVAVARARRALDALEATWRERVHRMADLLDTPNTEGDRR